MSHLTQRAEQALLGVLLADPDVIPANLYTFLESADFGHRAHQQVFAALTDLHLDQPYLRGERLLSEVARRVDSPGADAAWLQRMREHASRPQHVTAYAQMIKVSAFRREVTTHLERLSAGQGPSPLVQALTRQSDAYQAVAAENPATADPAPPWAAPGTSAGAPTPAGRRATAEDTLLADLLRHPEQAATLARILPDDTFSTPQRREVYRAVLTLAEAGDLIDEVIVAWQLENLRSLSALYGGDIARNHEPTRSGREPDVAYLARLAATPTSRPATETARDLIAEDIRTELAAMTGQPRPGGPAPIPAGPQSPARQPMPLEPPQHRPPPPGRPGPNHRPQP